MKSIYTDPSMKFKSSVIHHPSGISVKSTLNKEPSRGQGELGMKSEFS